MARPRIILGAPSSIGIRPYDNGGARRLDRAPAALRDQGLAARIGAADAGDAEPPAYEDFERPAGRARNEGGVERYSRALGRKVERALGRGAFAVVLGGDCSIVLGCLLGARGAARPRVGLIYIDAHSDFATPELSRSGSAASMCLALAIGRGDSPLARLDGPEPLVSGRNVVLIGRRDQGDAPWYGQEDLDASSILDLPHDTVRERGAAAIAREALDHLARGGVEQFWIHVDADVLDPSVMPAVDSPEPGGLGLDELARLLQPLVRDRRALGLELTIYDPALDADRSSAARLASLLERVLNEGGGS